MILRKILLTTFSLISILIFISGISRHDVPEDKYLRLAAEKQFDCVGQVLFDTVAHGSCVLVSENYVLTAAHIFILSEIKIDTIEMNGHKIEVFNPINQRITDAAKLYIDIKGQKRKVKRIIIHPVFLEDLVKHNCDLALLELELPILKIATPSINNELNEMKSDVVGVGFGVSGPANDPGAVSNLGKKIAGENVIDSIAGYKYRGIETLILSDFDHPTRTDCNKMGSKIPRPLEYGPAGGDSGGPLFRKEGDEWVLIGICHGNGIDIDQFFKTGYYGQVMTWTRTSVFARWIKKNIKKCL